VVQVWSVRLWWLRVSERLAHAVWLVRLRSHKLDRADAYHFTLLLSTFTHIGLLLFPIRYSSFICIETAVTQSLATRQLLSTVSRDHKLRLFNPSVREEALCVAEGRRVAAGARARSAGWQGERQLAVSQVHCGRCLAFFSFASSL
jgi:hypothetical protein